MALTANSAVSWLSGARSCPAWCSGAEPSPRPCPQPGRWPRRGRRRLSFGPWGGRARAASGPASRDLVLLPYPGLIADPDLDLLATGLGLRKLLQTGGE